MDQQQTFRLYVPDDQVVPEGMIDSLGTFKGAHIDNAEGTAPDIGKHACDGLTYYFSREITTPIEEIRKQIDRLAPGLNFQLSLLYK